MLTIGGGQFAAAAELDAVVAEVESSIPVEYQKLVEYRRRVEEHAYRETMHLCAGYRMVRGLGAGSGGDWTAWTRLFGHGLVQPFSAFVGLKADFNSANRIKTWDVDAWLRSTHALYLVHSDGFTKAATECLNTADADEIRWFSAAILGVDIVGSLPGHAALLWTSGRIIGIGLKITRPIWSPVTGAVSRLAAHVSRRQVVVAGLVVVPIAGGAAFEYVEHLRIGLQAAKTFVESMDDEQFRLIRTKRMFLMSDAVLKLGAGLDAGSLDDFEVWARANFRAADRADAHRDYEMIRMNESGESTDESYGKVLKAVLPVLDQLDLNP